MDQPVNQVGGGDRGFAWASFMPICFFGGGGVGAAENSSGGLGGREPAAPASV